MDVGTTLILIGALAYVVTTWAQLLAPYAARAWKRLQLPRPRHLPLTSFHTREVIYTESDWRRDNLREHPFRYVLTETLPRVLRLRQGDKK